MSSMKLSPSKWESINSILNYLREPSPSEVVPSTSTTSITDSTTINNSLKSTKKPKKEKELMNVTDPTQINLKQTQQISSSGRIRYGPITVNPRKQPSKTLFTGRRSKYEILQGDEEEKRRLRRERNRVAATKCREKRENVLVNLEREYNKKINHYNQLSNLIQQLEQRKQYLQSLVSNQTLNSSVIKINSTPPPQQPTMVFGNTGFLPSIMDAPLPPPLPPHHLQHIQNEEEKFSQFLQPPPVLTNSAYNINQSDNLFTSQQQSQQQSIIMNSSSLERLINSLHSPIPHIPNNNNNNYSGLFNSAYGSSSCAQQHSHSSEDDSLPSAHNNSYVC